MGGWEREEEVKVCVEVDIDVGGEGGKLKEGSKGMEEERGRERRGEEMDKQHRLLRYARNNTGSCISQ